jgi:hypothetical protein
MPYPSVWRGRSQIGSRRIAVLAGENGNANIDQRQEIEPKLYKAETSMPPKFLTSRPKVV